jgi:hypothetical protein
VPAIVFGIPIISVTIEADVPHFHRGRWRSESDMALANLVTLCLAGPAAETIHIGPITDGSDHIDFEMARRYLAEGGVDRLLAGAALTPLSFPKIISARSDDAVHPRRAQQRRYQTVGLLDTAAHPCAVIGACAIHYSRWRTSSEFASGAPRQRSASDPGTRDAQCRSGAPHTRFARRSRRDRAVTNTHGSQPGCKDMSIGSIIIAHQIGRRRCPGEGLSDLSGQPLGCRMSRDLKP